MPIASRRHTEHAKPAPLHSLVTMPPSPQGVPFGHFIDPHVTCIQLPVAPSVTREDSAPHGQPRKRSEFHQRVRLKEGMVLATSLFLFPPNGLKLALYLSVDRGLKCPHHL